MKRLLLLLMIALILASCSTEKYKVEDIRMGLHLNDAKEESVATFFKKRMTNSKDYKVGAIERRWNIIAEDKMYVYYGFTQHPGIGGDVDVPLGTLDVIFKVNRGRLMRDFPEYKKWQGHHLRQAVKPKFNHQKDSSLFRQLCETGIPEWIYDLEKESFRVEYRFNCQGGHIKKIDKGLIYRYVFDLSRTDLKIIRGKRYQRGL